MFLCHSLYLLVCDATFYFVLWREQFLFSSDAAEELKQGIAKKNHELVFLYDKNLVDEIWKESRPQPPNKPIRVHDLKYAGTDVSSKLLSLRSELVEVGSSAIVISMLDEVAWLLNLVIFLNITLKFLGSIYIKLMLWYKYKIMFRVISIWSYFLSNVLIQIVCQILFCREEVMFHIHLLCMHIWLWRLTKQSYL